jgi:hypothetical protein
MRFSALVGLVVLALAGCGGSAASLDDAADATSAETARFELDYRVTGGPKESDYTMQAAGEFDFPGEKATMTIDGEVPFFGDDVFWEEFRLIGTTGYMRWLVKGKPYWVKSDQSDSGGDPTELLVPLPGSPTKPTDVLARVLLTSDENDELGEEEIRGTKTTHYRARVDVRKLVRQLRAQDRPDGDAVELWGARFIPVELWIDDESRLRRITTVHDRGGARETMAVDLYDYGIDVEVQPPPADELVSEEEFDKVTDEFFEIESGVEVCNASPSSKKPDRECLEQRKP